jgi:hypothetical protein
MREVGEMSYLGSPQYGASSAPGTARVGPEGLVASIALAAPSSVLTTSSRNEFVRLRRED